MYAIWTIMSFNVLLVGDFAKLNEFVMGTWTNVGQLSVVCVCVCVCARARARARGGVGGGVVGVFGGGGGNGDLQGRQNKKKY